MRQTATADYPTLRRHRLGVGLYDKVEGTAGAAYLVRDRRRGRAAPRSPSWSATKQPDLLLLNEGDLAYAKIRLDERSLETVVTSIETIDDSLARALCWGAAWDMTRDAEMSATDFVDPGALGHRLGDRRVRRQPDPGLRRPGGHAYSAPGNRAALRAKWERACASC